MVTPSKAAEDSTAILLKQLDPTDPAALTATDGVPPPASVKEEVRKAEGGVFASLVRRFLDGDAITQSAALAFYAALSLAPLMLLLVWATASTWPSAGEAVMAQIRLLVGAEVETVARTIVENARATPDTGSLAGWWSVALLSIGATAVFAQLQEGINRVFRTDPTALDGFVAWVRKRVLSFGVLIGLAFLLLVSMTLTTGLEFLFSRVDWILPVVGGIALLLVYILAFALMYHFLPDRRVRWSLAVLGGAFTAVLFVAGRSVITWYLQQTPTASSYGAMGALALTMLWVYYAAIILYLGATVTAVLDERLGKRRARSQA